MKTAFYLMLDWHNPKPGAIFTELRGRSGILATVNLIPLIVLAGRDNIAIPILRVSFDTFQPLPSMDWSAYRHLIMCPLLCMASCLRTRYRILRNSQSLRWLSLPRLWLAGLDCCCSPVDPFNLTSTTHILRDLLPSASIIRLSRSPGNLRSPRRCETACIFVHPSYHPSFHWRTALANRSTYLSQFLS